MEPVIPPAPLPLSVSIPGGISPHRCVVVEGTVPDHAESFTIRLQCGPNVRLKDDVPLSVKFSFGDRTEFTANSFLDREWGREETKASREKLWEIFSKSSQDDVTLLHPGDTCCICIECHDMGFTISVDSEYLHDYVHRTDYVHICFLVLLGDFQVARAGVLGGGGPTRWMVLATPPGRPWTCRYICQLCDENFKEKVLPSKRLWLVMFHTAQSCQLQGEFESAAVEVNAMLPARVQFAVVDCLVNLDTAVMMGVRQCPTILYYPKGRKTLRGALRYTGAYSAQGIVSWTLHVAREKSGPPPGLNSSMPPQYPLLLVTKVGMRRVLSEEEIATPDTVDWASGSRGTVSDDEVIERELSYNRRVSFQEDRNVVAENETSFIIKTLESLDERLTDLIKKARQKKMECSSEIDEQEMKEKIAFSLQPSEEYLERIKKELQFELKDSKMDDSDSTSKGTNSIEENAWKLIDEVKEGVLKAEESILDKGSGNIKEFYLPELQRELRQFIKAVESVERARSVLAKFKRSKEAFKPGTSKLEDRKEVKTASVGTESAIPCDTVTEDKSGSVKNLLSRIIPSISSNNAMKPIVRSILSSAKHTEGSLDRKQSEQSVFSTDKVKWLSLLTKISPVQIPLQLKKFSSAMSVHSRDYDETLNAKSKAQGKSSEHSAKGAQDNKQKGILKKASRTVIPKQSAHSVAGKKSGSKTSMSKMTCGQSKLSNGLQMPESSEKGGAYDGEMLLNIQPATYSHTSITSVLSRIVGYSKSVLEPALEMLKRKPSDEIAPTASNEEHVIRNVSNFSTDESRREKESVKLTGPLFCRNDEKTSKNSSKTNLKGKNVRRICSPLKFGNISNISTDESSKEKESVKLTGPLCVRNNEKTSKNSSMTNLQGKNVRRICSPLKFRNSTIKLNHKQNANLAKSLNDENVGKAHENTKIPSVKNSQQSGEFKDDKTEERSVVETGTEVEETESTLTRLRSNAALLKKVTLNIAQSLTLVSDEFKSMIENKVTDEEQKATECPKEPLAIQDDAKSKISQVESTVVSKSSKIEVSQTQKELAQDSKILPIKNTSEQIHNSINTKPEEPDIILITEVYKKEAFMPIDIDIIEQPDKNIMSQMHDLSKTSHRSVNISLVDTMRNSAIVTALLNHDDKTDAAESNVDDTNNATHQETVSELKKVINAIPKLLPAVRKAASELLPLTRPEPLLRSQSLPAKICIEQDDGDRATRSSSCGVMSHVEESGGWDQILRVLQQQQQWLYSSAERTFSCLLL